MYDFTNKAIKCDTWEQMEHVAEIARKQGGSVTTWFNTHPCTIEDGYSYFISTSENIDLYGNYRLSHIEPTETIISYSDFITSNIPQQ